MSELVARINALMMRYKRPTQQKQQIGDLEIDWTIKKAFRGEVQLSLNATDWI